MFVTCSYVIVSVLVLSPPLSSYRRLACNHFYSLFCVFFTITLPYNLTYRRKVYLFYFFAKSYQWICTFLPLVSGASGFELFPLLPCLEPYLGLSCMITNKPKIPLLISLWSDLEFELWRSKTKYLLFQSPIFLSQIFPRHKELMFKDGGLQSTEKPQTLPLKKIWQPYNRKITSSRCVTNLWIRTKVFLVKFKSLMAEVRYSNGPGNWLDAISLSWCWAGSSLYIQPVILFTENQLTVTHERSSEWLHV